MPHYGTFPNALCYWGYAVSKPAWEYYERTFWGVRELMQRVVVYYL